MKPQRIASLLLLAGIALAGATSASAGTLYENGPVTSANVEAWNINFGFSVSDSVVANGNVQGLLFWATLLPGDTVTGVEVSLGSSPFASDLFDGFLNVTQLSCMSDAFGFNLCEESATFNGPNINGTAWLTLQNATAPSGDPVWWTENSGIGCQSPGCPSDAFTNQVEGTIPSEAFTLLGTPGTGSTPEPGGILLFGSGVLGLGSLLRRRL